MLVKYGTPSTIFTDTIGNNSQYNRVKEDLIKDFTINFYENKPSSVNTFTYSFKINLYRTFFKNIESVKLSYYRRKNIYITQNVYKILYFRYL